MSKNRFVLNQAVVGHSLLKGEMVTACAQVADRIASRAGNGFRAFVKYESTRGYAGVRAETNEAKRKCLKENALLKAVGK